MVKATELKQSRELVLTVKVNKRVGSATAIVVEVTVSVVVRLGSDWVRRSSDGGSDMGEGKSRSSSNGLRRSKSVV